MQRLNKTFLILSFVPPFAVGIIAGILTGSNTSEVLQGITRPPLTPPAILFPIVWTILYFLMGAATYIIYESKAFANDLRKAFTIFYGQLFVNFIWPFVFANLGNFLLAFLILVILDFLVALNVLAYSRIQRISGLLLLPYLLWCAFATYLNLAIVILN